MESNGKKIVKQECLDEVWERVELRMRMQGISQTRLVELCKEAGYMITQPEISKLKRKKCKITLYQTMAFSEALDTPLEYLIKGKIVEEGDVKKVLRNPEHPYTKLLLASGAAFMPDPYFYNHSK